MTGLQTLRECPAYINAGDTLLFEIANVNYPASDWTLSYYFRGQYPISFTATASDNKHLVNVSAADTATWYPTDYKGVAKFTNIADPTQVITWWQGSFKVNPDLASVPDDYDTRSWAKKCLDAIDAVLANKATKDVLHTTIAGQSIGRMAPEQLFALRDRFYTLYQQELAAEDAANKRPQRSNIGITFVLPA